MIRPTIGRLTRFSAMLAYLGLVPLVLFTGCSKSPNDVPPLNKNLGGSVAALPVSGTTDIGILKDQTGYKAAGGGPRGGGLSGSEREQVQELVNTLLKAMKSIDVNTILDSFVAEDVAALRDQADVLFSTTEKMQQMRTSLVGKFGEEAVSHGEAEDIKKIADAVRIEVIDADNASITPNFLLPILGPTKGISALAARRVDNAWKLSLPISADDAAGILAFHKVLARALDSVTKQIEEGNINSFEQLQPALMLALAGGGATGAVDSNANQPQSDLDKPISDIQTDDGGRNPRTTKGDEEQKDEGDGGG